jgi:hypothetical protein
MNSRHLNEGEEKKPAKPKRVRLDYRYYSPTRKCFNPWEYFGHMTQTQAEAFLKKNNRHIEYRIWRKA